MSLMQMVFMTAYPTEVKSMHHFMTGMFDSQVVAYTSSPLKRAILNQFVRCDVILPNAFVGTLTRESVTNALQAGIDHEMIIRYLTQHADPHTATCTPVVPAVKPSFPPSLSLINPPNKGYLTTKPVL